ncbi:MAG: rhodanese-like domain-containing protein, partial [Gemmatimonadota bacterium]
VLHGFVRPPETPSAKLQQLLKSDAQIIDTRPAAAHAEGHVPGTLSIPLNKSFTSWAGWLLSYDRDIYLLLDDKAGEKALDEAIRDLAMIGFDRVTGVFPSGVIEHWTREGGRLETTTQVSTDELSKGLGEVTVVDVRALSEWEAGHIPGALHIPLGHLADRIREIPADRPVVMQCQGGGRSAIAASVAQKLGRKDVSNLTGGYGAWDAAGNTTQR